MSVRLDHGDVDLEEVHEINVTPFIDVMLVLLIIFMIAAPLATVDISVDLPASTAQVQPRPERPLFLTSHSRSAIRRLRAKALRPRSIRRPAAIEASACSCAPISA
jgi:biopolymer transport protein ExbD